MHFLQTTVTSSCWDMIIRVIWNFIGVMGNSGCWFYPSVPSNVIVTTTNVGISSGLQTYCTPKFIHKWPKFFLLPLDKWDIQQSSIWTIIQIPQHNLDFYWYLKNLYSIFVILCSSKYKSTNLNSAERRSLCGQKTVLPESWERPETIFIRSYLMLANIGSVTRLWIASWKVHKLSALLMVMVACICLWGKYYRLERNY